MNSCEICGTTLRSDNRSGLCQRTPACKTERKRRETERAGGTGPRCLCSHPADHHWGSGECMHRACGCGEWRLDARSPVRYESAEEIAATGTDG